MDKLKMQSIDMTEKNIDKIGAIFPNVITEMKSEDGKLKKGIDFEKLKQELLDDTVDGEESYDFTWVGKKASIIEGNTPIRKTLRPCIDESKDWETTENLYIEGDNLDVLKLLQESYLNSIKMIYIDPPYNTGNDFIYRDKFTINKGEYDEQIGLYDEYENKLFQNNESNGRFHSDWCSMLYPRLKLAQTLLADDGIVFISIDDNEVENLKKICNEIFGEENSFIPFIWELPRGINAGVIARSHEYILVFAKNKINVMHFNRTNKDSEDNISIERCNRKIEARHPASAITFPEGMRYEGFNQAFKGKISGSEEIEIIGEMVFEDGKLKFPVTLIAGWTMKSMINDWMNGKEVVDLKGQKIDEFFFKSNGKLYSKKVLNVQSAKSVLKNFPDTQKGRAELTELFRGLGIFEYPKPSELIKYLVKLSTNSSDLILDFFSGSATTAHAVMQLNAEDGGNRKFIMVNLPEPCGEDSETFIAGYKNICEIGKERIRRAGDKINGEILRNNKQLKMGEEEKQPVDIGFRVLKVDSTNMKDVYYSANQYNQQMLEGLESNIKEDRTDLDLLYGVLLDWGLPLSLSTLKHNYGDVS